jgi:hypothetical protein
VSFIPRSMHSDDVGQCVVAVRQPIRAKPHEAL